MTSLGRDLKAHTAAVFASTSTAVTAAGSGDATEITGASIDRLLYEKAESVVFCVPVRAVLAAAKAITINGLIEDSADGSSWATFLATALLLTLTDSGSGSTLTGVARVGSQINTARRYIRLKCTPDMTATATDTAVVGAGVAIFGGLNQL